MKYFDMDYRVGSGVEGGGGRLRNEGGGKCT